ncbi:MAG: hypothetical protein R3B84_02665 [Zavarzinella sp.]
MKVFVGTRNGFAIEQIFRDQVLAISRQNVTGFFGFGCFAFPQRCQRAIQFPRLAHFDVDVVALQHCTVDVGAGLAVLQHFDGGRFIAKRFQKGIGKIHGIEGGFRQFRDCLFNFYGVHFFVVAGLQSYLFVLLFREPTALPVKKANPPSSPN